MSLITVTVASKTYRVVAETYAIVESWAVDVGMNAGRPPRARPRAILKTNDVLVGSASNNMKLITCIATPTCTDRI